MMLRSLQEARCGTQGDADTICVVVHFNDYLLFTSVPEVIVTILTFFFYTIVWHGALSTTIAFPALATFTVLRIPLNRMADSITFLIQAHVSLRRVTDFLRER